MSENKSLIATSAEWVDALVEAEGDIDNESVAQLMASITSKAEGCYHFRTSLQAERAKYEAFIAPYIEHLERIKKAQARFDDYLLTAIDRTGGTEIEGQTVKLCIKLNPPAVDVYDEAALPREFMVQPPPPPTPPAKPDKNAIKAAINSGVDVPGARLVRGKKLEVRPVSVLLKGKPA